MGIRRLLCRVADVRGHWDSDWKRTGSQRARIWPPDLDPRADWRVISPAARHLDRQVRGRIVMFAVLVGCAVPVWFASYASQLWQFLLLGLALGGVGASFAVGTPYVARFFAKDRRGFALWGCLAPELPERRSIC